jgi:hypothetical protein
MRAMSGRTSASGMLPPLNPSPRFTARWITTSL